MADNKLSIYKILSSNISVIFIIINTIIGVGIITLPSSILSGGFFFMVLYAFVCVYLIYYTSIALATSSLKGENVKTYGELCYECYGEFFRGYLCFNLFLLMYGFATVYFITLRAETANLISEITGKTFKYDKYVLLGMAAGILLFCILKNLSMLSYGSFVSALCVIFMILVSCLRSPFYYSKMTSMSKEKMLVIEKSLDIDRAIWSCKQGKEVFSLENWPRLEVLNFDVLENSLHELNACSTNNLSWERVLRELHKLKTLPVLKTPVENIETWADVINYEHPRYVFNKNSLNQHGKKERRFTLFSFFGPKLYMTIGTIASAFIYQQASIENMQDMKNIRKRDYKIVVLFSFIIVFVFSMTIAFAGYFGQQYQVQQFIFSKMKLRYFDAGKIDYLVVCGRVALILSIILTYPMQFYFGRVNLMILIVIIKNKVRGTEDDHQNPSNIIFYVTTAAMFATSLLVGLFFDNAEDLFSLVGSAIAGQMIYILPIICWYAMEGGYKTVIKEIMAEGNKMKILKKVVFPNTILVFGVLVTICSTITSILQLADVI